MSIGFIFIQAYNKFMDEILFINACVRTQSRTKRLADYLLAKLEGNIKEINLNDKNILPLNKNSLAYRSELTSKQDFSNPIFNLAKEFASADIIVIAAPFWDLSFPTLLKSYIEAINIIGIVFFYGNDGKPRSLCKAKKLYYVTTSGGEIFNSEFGFGYIKTLAQKFYDIQDFTFIKAENLDITGADVEKILKQAEHDIDMLD